MGRIAVPPKDKSDDPPVLYMTVNIADGLSIDGVLSTLQLYKLSYTAVSEEWKIEVLMKSSSHSFINFILGEVHGQSCKCPPGLWSWPPQLFYLAVCLLSGAYSYSQLQAALKPAKFTLWSSNARTCVVRPP